MKINHDDPVIKVGYLVSYDWQLLKNSIPAIYADAGKIVLAIDINRTSWAGRPYSFAEEEFRAFIREVDIGGKIELYEDNFFDPSLTTMQNEVREGKMLAAKRGTGGWHVQFDCDEYPIDFKRFVATLKEIDPDPDPSRIRKPVNVTGNFVPVIKAVEGGFLIVKPDPKSPELCTLATQVPDYISGRRSGHFNIQTSLLIVHETQSRTEEEFYYKLKNWGHNADFDIDKHFALWKSLDARNFASLKNFNPVEKTLWPALLFIKANDIQELIQKIAADQSIQRSWWSLFWANSRMIARAKTVFRRVRRSQLNP